MDEGAARRGQSQAGDAGTAQQAAPAHGTSRALHEAPAALPELVSQWLDSDLKVTITAFYRENPGVIETLEGLARRLGTSAEVLRSVVESHVRLGLLQERRAGNKTILVFDARRQRELEQAIANGIHARLGGAT